MPNDYRYGDIFGYTTAQMLGFAKECIAYERRRCAQICDAEATAEGIAQKCAAIIRGSAQFATQSKIQKPSNRLKPLLSSDIPEGYALVPEHVLIGYESALNNITQYVAANGDTWPADRAFAALVAAQTQGDHIANPGKMVRTSP